MAYPQRGQIPPQEIRWYEVAKLCRSEQQIFSFWAWAASAWHGTVTYKIFASLHRRVSRESKLSIPFLHIFQLKEPICNLINDSILCVVGVEWKTLPANIWRDLRGLDDSCSRCYVAISTNCNFLLDPWHRCCWGSAQSNKCACDSMQLQRCEPCSWAQV